MTKTSNVIIDFDTLDWVPSLEAVLKGTVPNEVREKLQRSSYEYRDDARDEFEASVPNIDIIIDKTLEWIRSSQIRAFHGTRITDEEVKDIIEQGLKPLDKSARIDWLLSEFPEIANTIDKQTAINLSASHVMGEREGQVHLALSKRLMLSDYDYLFKGSEFDRRLIEFSGHQYLLPLLTERGKPRLISVNLPGEVALAGAHPFFSIEMTRQVDRYPNLVGDLLMAFAWQIHKPRNSVYSKDSCLMFKCAIPGSYIHAIETID